jgi:hypothetical protein
MSGSDGTSSNTRVCAARRAWVRMSASGYAMSYLILNGLATRGSQLGVTCPVLATPRHGYRGLGCVPR